MFYLPFPYTESMTNTMKTITLPGPNPGCQICSMSGHDPVPDAVADIPTSQGPWAYLCKKCMKLHGIIDGTMGTMIVWK